jgi:hypothetical protein
MDNWITGWKDGRMEGWKGGLMGWKIKSGEMEQNMVSKLKVDK